MVSPFDRIASNYDLWFEKEGAKIYLSELLAFYKILSFHDVNENTKILDVGTGTGRFVEILRRKVFGVDPSLNMLKITKNRIVPVNGVCENLPFKDKSFDLVTLMTTICFVKDKIGCLNECKRVIKKSGSLIIGFINKHSEWGRLYEERAREGDSIYKYAQFMDVEELILSLKNLDYKPDFIVSSLLTTDVSYIHQPIPGFVKDAGFIIISASLR